MATSPNYDEMSALANQFRKRSGITHTFTRDDGDYLVYLLQKGLYNNGYNLHLNSAYDDATEAAVRAYQRDHGFVENGIAGPDMLNRLFPADPPVTAVSLPAPAPLMKPTPRAVPMLLPAPKPVPKPIPTPLPAPSHPGQTRPKPVEYTVRLNGRNPEAVIRVIYDQ